MQNQSLKQLRFLDLYITMAVFEILLKFKLHKKKLCLFNTLMLNLVISLKNIIIMLIVKGLLFQYTTKNEVGFHKDGFFSHFNNEIIQH